MYSLPLVTPIIPETSNIAATDRIARNKGILRKNEATLKIYTSLVEKMTEIVEMGESGEVHWRYELMSAAIALRLIKTHEVSVFMFTCIILLRAINLT